MGLTYAPNGVLVGMAAGLLVGVKTHSVAAGIAVAVVASVVCWYAIRGVEILLGRGLSAGFTALENRLSKPNRAQWNQPPPQPPVTGAYPQAPQPYPGVAPPPASQQQPNSWGQPGQTQYPGR
ncbi:hypothetical protein M2432_002548 [Mycobacterium sp. OTB74]|jgi:hypothetical protein|nr:hypothetical protein [Mycobacterium sp. OTB74]